MTANKPAFPLPANIKHAGMGLRTYIATAAMQAYISRVPYEEDHDAGVIAEDAVMIANRLMRELESDD